MLYHLENKTKKKHRYFPTLSALYLSEGKELGVSKPTLDRWDWVVNGGMYENNFVIIRQGCLEGTQEIKLTQLWGLLAKEGLNPVLEFNPALIRVRNNVIEYKKGFLLNGKPIEEHEILQLCLLP